MRNNYIEDMRYASRMENEVNKFISKKLNKTVTTSIENIQAITEKKLQYAGVDKKVFFSNNTSLRIEEKVRRKDYGDLLIEIIADHRFASVDMVKRKIISTKKRGLGWGFKDYQTDLLVYYYESTKRGYMLSWKKFKEMLKVNFNFWYGLAINNSYGFSIKKAKNRDINGEEYFSINITIPKNMFEIAYKEIGGKII